MVQVKSEQQILQEGIHILLHHMESSSVARFLAACNIGRGNYLQLKDELLGSETVESLYTKIVEFQQSQPK